MVSYLAVIFAYVVWGATSPVMKYALTDIPPFVLLFIRFFGASLILLPFTWKEITQIKSKIIPNLLIGSVGGIAVAVSLFFIGLTLAPSINAGVIGSLGPLLLYLMSLRVLHEKPHPEILRGMLVALAGILVIILAPLLQSDMIHSESHALGLSAFLGNLAFVGATIFSVLLPIENKKISGSIRPLTLTVVQFGIASLCVFPFMIPELAHWSVKDMTPNAWVGVLYGIFFASLGAFVALNFALKKLHVQDTAIFHYVSPIVAVLVAYPLLGERPDIFFVIGAVFVAVGIYIAEKHPHMHKIKKRMRGR